MFVFENENITYCGKEIYNFSAFNFDILENIYRLISYHTKPMALISRLLQTQKAPKQDMNITHPALWEGAHWAMKKLIELQGNVVTLLPEYKSKMLQEAASVIDDYIYLRSLYAFAGELSKLLIANCNILHYPHNDDEREAAEGRITRLVEVISLAEFDKLLPDMKNGMERLGELKEKAGVPDFNVVDLWSYCDIMAQDNRQREDLIATAKESVDPLAPNVGSDIVTPFEEYYSKHGNWGVL